MIIQSKATAVMVLKAMDMPNLRIFPGPNEVEQEGLDRYFDGNPAAKAMQKEHFTIIGAESLSPDQKKLSLAAKEKNEMMNKAKKTIKKNLKTIEKGNETIAAQAKQLEEQAVMMADMKKQLDALTAKKSK